MHQLRMITIIKGFIAIGACCLPLGFALASPNIQFTLKPRLCVLAEGEELCRDTIEINWSTPTPSSLCLYKGEEESPLACWDSVKKGAFVIELAASDNINFSLREKTKNTFLVTQSFEVVQESTRYRRRNRNPWSFF